LPPAADIGARIARSLVSRRPTNILTSIFMPTSVHLPKPLLVAVDRRARALRISRNRLIVRALERELAESSEWSAEFLDELARTDDLTREAVGDMVKELEKRRTSKGPPKL